MTTTFFIAEILRYFIGFFLLAAALGKLGVAMHFQRNLVQSFGMSTKMSRVLAPAVIGAEFIVAAMVLVAAERVGMLISLLMFCAFSALLSYKFFTESVVKCSCFGEAERAVSLFDLVRNLLVIAAIAIWLLLPSGPALPVQVAILAAALASVLCVLAIEFHGIAAVLARS